MKLASIILVLIFLFACEKSHETKYYDNGVVKSEARVSEGKYIGDFTTFYPNGKVKAKGYWKNGIGDGYIERYFENGRIEEKAYWEDGQLHGPSQVYYPNGNLRLSATFKNGCKIDDYIIYHQSQSVSEIRKYDKNCNLYYMVKLDPTGNEELELFYPIFSTELRKDSLLISFKSKLIFSGVASVTIGQSQKSTFIPISSRIQLKDTITQHLKVPREINANSLVYKFEYIAAEYDTLNSFLIETEILRDSTLKSSKELELEFI